MRCPPTHMATGRSCERAPPLPPAEPSRCSTGPTPPIIELIHLVCTCIQCLPLVCRPFTPFSFDLIYLVLDRFEESRDRRLARHLVSLFHPGSQVEWGWDREEALEIGGGTLANIHLRMYATGVRIWSTVQ